MTIFLFIFIIITFAIGGGNLMFGAGYMLIIFLIGLCVMVGFCIGSISEYSKKPEKRAEQKIYAEDLTDIITCNNCGTQMKKTMKFCTQCGAEL